MRASRWADTNSSQANGSASGNVISRLTVMASSVITTENVNAPTNTSSIRWVSAHHVAGSRQGRRRPRITLTP